MINAFQLTCLIIFWVVGSAIVNNPDVAWVFANLHVIFDRFVFSRWYMICTHPTVVVLHMLVAPKLSTAYYYLFISTPFLNLFFLFFLLLLRLRSSRRPPVKQWSQQ